MIRNYFVVSIRNFLRNKNYSLINILGLSIGVTCCIVIYLLIMHDLSFDRFHQNASNIYRIVLDSENASGVEHSRATPYPFANAFRNDFTDVPLVTQYHDQGETMVVYGDNKILLDHVIFADSAFFRLFDFKVESGNPAKALKDPGKVFLTASTARKIFGSDEPTRFKIKNVIDVEVAGIIADPPANSHIQFSMVVSMPSFSEDILGLPIDQWGINSSGYCYIALTPDVSPESIEQRLVPFTTKYHPEDDVGRKYRLQALSDIHFDSRYQDDAVSKTRLMLLGLLGLFIVVIACINFINLATALAMKKSKEIGIRKTLGAARRQLVTYFLGETFLLVIFATLISLGIVEWMLPLLNTFMEKEISRTLFNDINLFGFVAVLVLTVTILAGLYPSLILSGYSPIAVLKNKITMSHGSGGVRKVLVVFQFVIAQLLIIATLIVTDQMAFFSNRSMGFVKDAIINVELPSNKDEHLQSFRTRLQSNPEIGNLSFSVGAPVSESGLGTSMFMTDGDVSQKYDVNIKVADEHYIDTYGLTLIAGRALTESDALLSARSLDQEARKYPLIVNRAAVERLGFDNPEDILGKNVTVGLNDISAPVVGVVENFHTGSMHHAIDPVVIMHFPYFYGDAGIKIIGDLTETLKFVEKEWKEVYPDYYFNYTFLDEHIAGLYRTEERMLTLFRVFSGISIFIGCLGLYGLISFMANQKQKEVGIRKVHGATVFNIITLFSKEFVRLIVIASFVAAPVCWYFMNEWLTGFAYHVEMHWSRFLIGIFATMVIALVTVGYKAFTAAIANPATTLKTE
ncbi:MAG TPA: ABC transporter permease [Chryseosolibacter sp.]|nr:ABC transporter permease [Chryseosolibacter sp.]